MQNKRVELGELRKYFFDDMTLMVPGFSRVGIPNTILHAIVEWGIKDINIITSSTGFHNRGPGMLVEKGLVKSYTAPFIGTNPEVVRQYSEATIEFNIIPMGTICERIRARAFGLGGVLTPTGVNTVIADGKTVINMDGKDYLLETPLRADLAIIHGYRADTFGNIAYNYTAENTNPIMAMAADVTIAEAETIEPVGSIDPREIKTPGYLVKALIQSERKYDE